MVRGPQAFMASIDLPPQTDPQVKLEWWIDGRQGDKQEAFCIGADDWEVVFLGVAPAGGQPMQQNCG
jgi:hypothetical protein